MARIFISVFCLCLGLSYITSKEYRTDYEYNEETDAFYKLHIESMQEANAQKTCELEGARLMLPSSHQDIVQVHRMFKNFPDLGEYLWVRDDGKDHESAEEPAIINLEPQKDEYTTQASWNQKCDVISRSGEVEMLPCYRPLPFVCKVDASDAPYNRECGVYGRDYVLAANLSSCYKIPNVPFSWNQAYAECVAEGAHLVILNSQEEHDFVHDLMKSNPAVPGTQAAWFFFAGFRVQPTTDGTPRVFKTIFNETLEQAGYSTWADNEPNNALNNENCGSLFKNDGKLNDVDCTHLYGFICEKNKPTDSP